MSRLFPLALLMAGCANLDTSVAARRDAANALDCPSEAVEMEQLGEYRYLGRGCGHEVTVACSASTLEPTCFAERTQGGEDASSPDAPPDVEGAIRGGLNARSDDVLACVGRERVGVRAVYGTDGAVVFALQGELAGTPEESCVRDALEGVRVAATGREGVIVHLVD